jgi:ribose 5-phosphate isomerase B
MKIVLGSDHRGYKYKKRIKNLLANKGVETIDIGCNSEESYDYSDFGIAAAEAVASGDVDRGIIICGTGNGIAMAANKVRGIRAALALNVEMAKLARAHNDANMLALSGMFTPENELGNIIDTFLTTEFEGGRHARRIGKISEYEKGS